MHVMGIAPFTGLPWTHAGQQGSLGPACLGGASAGRDVKVQRLVRLAGGHCARRQVAAARDDLRTGAPANVVLWKKCSLVQQRGDLLLPQYTAVCS